MTGVKEPKALWEDCVDIINKKLPFAVGRLYVEQYFKPEGKDDINKMIDQLNEAFKQLLSENNWMEDVTKKATLNKVCINFNIKIYYYKNYLFTARKNVESCRLS